MESSLQSISTELQRAVTDSDDLSTWENVRDVAATAAWTDLLTDVTLDYLIHQGEQASVYEAKLRGRVVVAKVFHGSQELGRREATFLAAMSHRCVIRMLGCFFHVACAHPTHNGNAQQPHNRATEKQYGIVFEPALRNAENDFMRVDLTDSVEILSLLLDVVVAVCHCHSLRCAHLDIKPTNILIVASKLKNRATTEAPGSVSDTEARSPARRLLPRRRAKLSDFGVSQWVRGERTVSGWTPGYAALDQQSGYFARPSYSFAADVYAIGCVLYNTLMGLGTQEDHTGALRSVEDRWRGFEARCRWSKVSRDLTDQLTRLTDRCLEQDARQRPTATEAYRQLFHVYSALLPSDAADDMREERFLVADTDAVCVQRAGVVAAIADAIVRHRAVIIRGASGSGKTVAVKQYVTKYARDRYACVLYAWGRSWCAAMEDLCEEVCRLGLSAPREEFDARLRQDPKAAADWIVALLSQCSTTGTTGQRRDPAAAPRSPSPFLVIVDGQITDCAGDVGSAIDTLSQHCRVLVVTSAPFATESREGNHDDALCGLVIVPRVFSATEAAMLTGSVLGEAADADPARAAFLTQLTMATELRPWAAHRFLQAWRSRAALNHAPTNAPQLGQAPFGCVPGVEGISLDDGAPLDVDYCSHVRERSRIALRDALCQSGTSEGCCAAQVADRTLDFCGATGTLHLSQELVAAVALSSIPDHLVSSSWESQAAAATLAADVLRAVDVTYGSWNLHQLDLPGWFSPTKGAVPWGTASGASVIAELKLPAFQKHIRVLFRWAFPHPCDDTELRRHLLLGTWGDDGMVGTVAPCRRERREALQALTAWLPDVNSGDGSSTCGMDILCDAAALVDDDAATGGPSELQMCRNLSVLAECLLGTVPAGRRSNADVMSICSGAVRIACAGFRAGGGKHERESFVALAERALTALRLLPGAVTPGASELAVREAASYHAAIRQEEGSIIHREALSLDTSSERVLRLLTARCAYDVGGMREETNDKPKAQKLKAEALALITFLRAGRTIHHPAMAAALNAYGYSLEENGERDRGLAYKQASLAIWRNLNQSTTSAESGCYGDHPELASQLDHVGCATRGVGQRAEGLRLRTEALNMRRRLYGNADHRLLAYSLNAVGRAMLDDALRPEGCDPRRPMSSPPLATADDTPCISTMHAGSLRAAGAWPLTSVQNAQELLEKALEMRGRIYLSLDHVDMASSLNDVGRADIELGLRLSSRGFGDETGTNVNDARLECRRGAQRLLDGFDMRKRLYAGDHRHVAVSLRTMGEALAKLATAGITDADVTNKMSLIVCPNGDPDADQLRVALNLQVQGLEMTKRLHQTDLVDLAASFSSLSDSFASAGWQNEAEDMQRTVHSLRDLR